MNGRDVALRWGFTPARGERVRILRAPLRAPDTEIERLVVDTLSRTGPVSPSALVSLVACALYRDDLAREPALADAGLFGENRFTPAVASALEAGRGALWSIEPGG